MIKLQPVRGMHDLIGAEAAAHRFVVDAALAISRRYGYGEISTPILEFSEVFHRTLGDTSDVVTKETYSFTDRGGESLTLRPEFTAAIARAFVSLGLQEQLPCRFFYAGPAFRYERPQQGRLRQFHQIGAELLGIAEVSAEVESIALAWHVLRALGLEMQVTLEINSLGDADSRAMFRQQLVEYLQQHEAQLSPESKVRLAKNPLRIFDSKSEADQAILAGAPRIDGAWNDVSKTHFATLCERLTALGIPFVHRPQLVRGLDYYTHVVFEFTTDALGAQNTVLAGGRYDGLIEQMGGTATPGVGWAAGVERLRALMALNPPHPCAPPEPARIVVIPMGELGERDALKLAQKLRERGFCAELDDRGKVAKRMKRADKIGARAAVLLGEEEQQRGGVTLRNLQSGTQEFVSHDGLESALIALVGAPSHD